MALSTGVACNEGGDCSAGGAGAGPAGGAAMDPVVSGLAAAVAGG
jgi:hypothetical protein